VTNSDRLELALFTLTGLTGVIDAVSFLGLGRVFTANMTGNVVLLGFAVAGAPGLASTRNAVSLVAFLVGAIAGGYIGHSMAGGSRHRWLLTAGLGEAALLCAAALVSMGVAGAVEIPTIRIYAVIALTAVGMGLRNATLARLAIPDLTTTVLTRTLTGVAADSSLAGGDNVRIGRRLLSVVTMFAGAVIGALLLRHGLALPLTLSAVCVAATYAAVPASPPQTTERP
jgi:uncharacterized membrane protein YoaK (UPF0700 family)